MFKNTSGLKLGQCLIDKSNTYSIACWTILQDENELIA